MTNNEKYKDIKERAKMFCKFCSSHRSCGYCQFNALYSNSTECTYAWEELEYKEELKPCPFCGGEAKLISSTMSRVGCETCGASSEFYDCDSDAIERWNRRK